jgi:V8-like Glu-specific endopeptidase
MRPRRQSASGLVIGVLAVAALWMPQAADARQVHATPKHQGVRAFWSPTRITHAVEATGPTPQLERATPAAKLAPPPFISEPVPDSTAPPYPATGLVVFRLGSFLYSCSGAIVDSPSARLVWTAAHCLRDPGRRGRFARKWAFIPGYDDGARPFGVWPASQLWVAPDWASNRYSEKVDFGAAVVTRAEGVGVETATGAAYQLATNQTAEQQWEAIGYPGDPAFGDQMWHCVSPFVRSDHAQPNRPGPLPIAIGCDATEGASGGPWISQAGTLGAVSTYGYSGQPDYLFGTYMGSQAAGLFSRVRTR